jgi:hypothetical protein
MTVEEMHYDFKIKFNKLDSSDYRNFQIPEIDWMLNEGMWLFLKQRYGINNAKNTGFEGSQKRIDDLRNLVIKNVLLPSAASTEPNSVSASLPADYVFAVRIKAETTTSDGRCKGDKMLTCRPTQHDDLDSVLNDPNYSPSYEWGEMPIVYGTLSNAAGDADTLFGYTDGSFTVNGFRIDYLREPRRIAFASGVPGGSYTYPDGAIVAANQDCELPEHAHKEIVDTAVLIAAGDINHPGFQIKMAKSGINE